MKWEHDSIEKYVVIMGKLINDISVTVENEEQGSLETLKVPVSYGPREKILAAANRQTIDDGDDAPKVAITFPRISFELAGPPMYDNSRMSPATSKVRLGDTDYIYNPPAYNIPFTVSIVAKSARIANRIMEKIVPLFVPSLTATIKPFAEYPDYKKDVIIEMQSVNPQNTYEGDFMQRQYVGWDLTFVMKAWLFGPITAGNRITKVEINFIDNTLTDDNVQLETATITPGLTSDGEPTSNSNLTIPRNSIQPTDNYGYITEYASEGE
jgi:hypothetical protein